MRKCPSVEKSGARLQRIRSRSNAVIDKTE